MTMFDAEAKSIRTEAPAGLPRKRQLAARRFFASVCPTAARFRTLPVATNLLKL